jgi:RHS repeat-associated protein
LGSVVALSDGAGAVSTTYKYSPYGEDETAALTGNPWRFTGRYLDAETGLYQYRARYYAPRLGQFLETDPIGAQDDPNLCLYVGLDPINATDPSGASFWRPDLIRTGESWRRPYDPCGRRCSLGGAKFVVQTVKGVWRRVTQKQAANSRKHGKQVEVQRSSKSTPTSRDARRVEEAASGKDNTMRDDPNSRGKPHHKGTH